MPHALTAHTGLASVLRVCPTPRRSLPYWLRNSAPGMRDAGDVTSWSVRSTTYADMEFPAPHGRRAAIRGLQVGSG